MLDRIIKGSLDRRKLVLVAAALLLIVGCVAMLRDTFDVDIFPRPKCSYGGNNDRGRRPCS